MIFLQLSQQLQSLSKLLQTLQDAQYTHKIEHLGNASIGGHTRHIIELLQCAITGYQNNKVDYVNRKRNLALEIDRTFAVSVLDTIDAHLRMPDKLLAMVVEEIGDKATPIVSTTYFREIVYNTEHTIHHLALIKVALIEMKLEVVDNQFGMAYSTIKYQATFNN